MAARWSLILFSVGVLGYFPAITIAFLVLVRFGAESTGDTEDKAYGLALIFFFLSEVVALILGIVGRRHVSGKVGMIGAIVALVFSGMVIAVGFLLFFMG